MKIGDQVRLRSGGPPMTVVKLKDDDVRCVWFESNEFLRQESFPAAALDGWEALEVASEAEAKAHDVPLTVENGATISGEGDMGEILAHSLEAQKQAALDKLEEVRDG